MIDERGAEGIAGGENDAQVDRSTPQPASEHSLTTDVLQHALAFKGSSGELFNGVVADVRALTATGGAVYPPVFPSWQEPQRVPALKTEPDSSQEGQLAPAEAVAFRVLGDESSALLQFFGRRFETSGKIDEVLGTGDEAWQSDAIEGIGELGGLLAVASGVRERMLGGQEASGSRSLQDIVKLRWDRMFRQALQQDGLRIHAHTTQRAVEEIERRAREQIPQNPGGARNEREIEARIAGRMRGATLARDLYLETVDHAAKILPAKI